MKYAKFCRQLRKYGKVDKSWSGMGKINNHTIPLAIIELNPVPRICELACGQQVENQHIEYRRIQHKNATWLVKCTNCGLYQDPVTGRMRTHKELRTYFMYNNKLSNAEE